MHLQAPETPALTRLVRLVAESADPQAALSRVQAGLLARALGGGDLHRARARAAGISAEAQALLHPFAQSELAVLPALEAGDALSRFYELLQARLQPAQRRALGQYFTPRPLVGAMWSLALEALHASGLALTGLRAVDPATGSGAFLVEGLARGLAGPQLLGVEILESALRTAAVNLALAGGPGPAPRLLGADAYAERTFAAMAAHLRGGQSALIIGNPPYNGQSPLLREPARLASARARLLPFARYHAPHSGFRDDFAYFFGLAHQLLVEADRPGVVCLITPSSLLDARDYQGLRRFLLERYAVQVVEVGPQAFPDARVATCISVLSRGGQGARHHRLKTPRESALKALAEQPSLAALGPNLAPQHPDYPLRPAFRVEALEREVDPVTEVLQRWFTPHKTGFDELLVDPDPERIWARLTALSAKRFSAEAFRARFGPRFSSERVQKKLLATRAWALGLRGFPERDRLWPYLRYNPRKARFAAPPGQWQHLYFEPRIATLFNHAFKGSVGRFHPHRRKPQLLFNTFERPLYAMVVEKPGVLHLYQHARFAPLRVPEGLWRARAEKVAAPDRGRPTLNFTPAWQARAALLRRPDDLFHLLAGIVQSALVQNLFGPELGQRRALPVKRFGPALAPLAQRIADRARVLAALVARGQPPGDLLAHLDADVLRLYQGADLPERELSRSELARALAQRP